MTSAATKNTQSQATEAPRPKLVLVDGHALIYRAYHALPPDLRTSRGEPTNAVFGFAQMLLDTIRIQAPQYVVVTFDKGRTFRHAASSDYKATRASMPDDLRQQIGRVRQLVEVLGIPIAELDNYEADDVIGTLSLKAETEGLETFILTADTDQHQLVSDHIRMIAPGGYAQRFSEAKIFDVAAVQERYGFGPELVPDFKALVGDKTDNIPNVPGIGDKTASTLLQQYGSLEAILDHIDDLKPKQAETLREHAQQARDSKLLTTIVRDAPVDLDLDASRLQLFDRQAVLRFLQDLEFRSLLPKVDQVEAVIASVIGAPSPATTTPLQSAPVSTTTSSANKGGKAKQLSMFPEESTAEEESVPTEGSPQVAQPLSDESRKRAGVPATVNIVRTEADLNKLVARLKANGRFVIDVESTSTDEMDAELVGISIAPSTPDGNVQDAYYVAIGHEVAEEGEGVTTQKRAKNQLTLEQTQRILGPLLADERVLKDAHNAKYDLKVLRRSGMPVEGLGYDTMLAAYLLGEMSIGLKDLGFNKLGVQMTPITDLIGKGRNQVTMAAVPVELAADYAAADVAVTERLRHYYAPLLQREGLESLLLDLEIKLVPVLVEMELAGVAIDVPWLQSLSTSMHSKIQELEQSIFDEAKHPFNVGSTQQLGRVLFEELQLPGRKRTQTGYSTDREVLDQLRGLHPIVDLIIEYRQLIKLKNTYIDALPLLVRRDTGRVHTNFNQAVAATGRLSSAGPNLQNIPIRTEIGRDVRKAFIADNAGKHRLFPDEESYLLAADYSQIELRLLAHMAHEQRLLDAFEQGLDIHAATAAEVMGVPIEKVDPDSRRLAKTINFGVLYGMGSYGLARDSGLTPAEAGKFIELYWSRYPAVRAFMDRTLEEGRQIGYVSTLMGRRRYMPELMSRNGGIRQQAERMAINAPVQGTAADIIKLAMNTLHDQLKERGLRSKMLLQVHDELLFEVPASELQEVGSLVCETMEGAMKLDVPLKVELKHGKNWGEMQPLKG